MSNPYAVRGIRNHNPGNIERTADRWKGMSDDQSSDPRFVVFTAPVWGLRALARIIRKDMEQGDTLRKIISEWAPSNENNTNAYVAAVAAHAKVDADSVITDKDLPAVLQAIVQHENGHQPYSDDLYDRALQLERSA